MEWYEQPEADIVEDEMMEAFGITPKRSNSMIGKLESASPTKSGKALRVKIDGNYYNAYLDSGLDKVVGQTIDFQTTPDKGYGLGVGQWKAAPTQPQQPPSPSPAPNPAPRVNTGGDRFYLPFVSNTVAHCIAAGLIKTPGEVSAWAKAAYDAAQALDSL